MNDNIEEEQLLKSIKLYSLTNQQNNLNPLKFISTPNLEDLKNENNMKGNNNKNQQSLNINNEINNNNLNISENELFNFELDQSTTSIITNQSVSHQLPIEDSPKKNNKIKDNLIEHNMFHSADIGEKAQNFNNNNYSSNDILKYKEIIKTLGEKLKNEYLLNKEQNNYIEILKHTINNYLLKKENSNIINLDKASKELNKNQLDILTDYTSVKTENERIKKHQVMQQILYDDIKNEITNLTKEYNNLKISNEKVIKENKSLKNIKEELSHNYDMLLSESEEIKNTLLKYEEEFTKCQKNNSDYIRLKSVNSELTANNEKQKNALMNLQNDFNTVNKSNNELSKYNEKLVKENQELKKELFLKKNELENINNKMNNNIKDSKEYNDALVINCAARKAKSVFDEIQNSSNENNLIIISCDTVVVNDNIIIGKPKDRLDAINILRGLSGKTHIVASAVCVASRGQYNTKVAKTKVTFRKISDEEIIDYIDRCMPYDKAGSYGIQDEGFDFVTKIEGDVDNVIGLPIKVVKELCS